MGIEEYRRGYEKGLEALDKVENETFADILERSVKFLLSAPYHALKEVFSVTHEDEERGFEDALEGRDFDY